MKRTSIFLVLLGLVIVAIIAINFTSNRPNKANSNPYALEIDEYKKVDPALIHHQEIRQFKVELDDHAAIATFNNQIYLANKSLITVLSIKGQQLKEIKIKPNARALAVSSNKIAIAHQQTVEVMDHSGNLIYETHAFSDSSVFTSVAIWDEIIIVADAGKRKLYGFKEGELTLEIEGISGAKNLHGFIVPSGYFELAVNTDGELWSTNPGMHALQNYDRNGNLITAWDKASLEIDGFNGCCNPAQFTFMSNGRFLTSEKGMPRIKIYSKTGELQSVVAPPSKFEGNQRAAEVCAIGETIIALDFDRELIRIFEPI